MPSPSERGTVIFFSKLLGGLYRIASDIIRGRDHLDLSGKVKLEGDHYIAIGEHADLWVGRLPDGTKVAVKLLRGGSSNNPAFVQKFTQNLQREGRVWRDLDHPNVSKFLGLAYNFGYMPALVLPFYDQGNVMQYLKNKTDAEKLHTVREVARGLHYLHQRPVVHGDIRGANILVDDQGRACLCDIGLSLLIEPSEFTSIKTAGACRWTAPEIMSPPEETDSIPESESTTLFTLESDIYAFAMTLLEIFTNKIPFSSKKNDSSVIFSVLDGGRPEIPSFSQEVNFIGGLIERCWAQRPDDRPKSRAVLEILDPEASGELETSFPVAITRSRWF